METLKNIFIDSLNGFAFDQIPLFIFQLLCAALASFLLQFIINKKWGDRLVEYAPLTATVIAIMASIAKYALPIAVLGAAMIVLLLGKKTVNKFEIVVRLIVVLVGIGCGVGSVVQTVIGCIILGVILLFTPVIRDDA